ncbi:MAG: HD domain-containing protein [Candidatus Falkowbacteria bacterium]
MKNSYSQAPFKFKKKRRSYALSIIKKQYEIPRTGWVDRQVEKPETVGEHTDDLIDMAKKNYPYINGLVAMLKVHDWPETDDEVGDARTDKFCPPEHRWSKEKKYEKEFFAMTQICEQLGPRGKYILRLWLEFEENKTQRAQIAKQLDRLQRIKKAISYQRNGQPVIAQDFIDNDEKYINDPKLIKILEKAKLRLTH